MRPHSLSEVYEVSSRQHRLGWDRLYEDLRRVFACLRACGMPCVEDYRDQRTWEEDFDLWLDGRPLKHAAKTVAQQPPGRRIEPWPSRRLADR